MIVPATTELQRLLHDDRTARLHASMHRPVSFAARRTAGAWLVSAGLRLAYPARRPGPAR
jgi:hypothetical protein